MDYYSREKSDIFFEGQWLAKRPKITKRFNIIWHIPEKTGEIMHWGDSVRVTDLIWIPKEISNALAYWAGLTPILSNYKGGLESCT